jgi:glycosyltransferase involved in cell wall biosynthesis
MAHISVVVPAYDEADRIQLCLREIALALKDLDYEIIVVDDGSQDSTYQEMVAAAAGNARIRPVRQSSNRGKGAAVLLGLQDATGEIIAFLDADLELHPSQLLSFIQTMRETGADVVVGSKRHPGSRLTVPWFRRITSVVSSRLIRFLFGLDLHDTQTGIKLFRADVLHRVARRLQVRRFAFDLELLVAVSRFGYRIVEAPVVVSFQRAHGGRIGALTIGHTFVDTLRVFYWASFWKWLDPSSRVKLLVVAFALGLIMATMGMAHWLTLHIPIPPQLSTLAWVLTLRFVDTQVRDWVMIVVGLLLVAWTLVELNKSLLAAFARADKGDLAGIMRRNHQTPGDLDQEPRDE